MQTREAPQAGKVKAEPQKRGTGQKSGLKVTLRDKTEVNGYASKIDEASFEVTDKKTGQVTTIPYSDVDKIGRPGLSKAAKIGIVVGVGVLVTVLRTTFIR